MVGMLIISLHVGSRMHHTITVAALAFSTGYSGTAKGRLIEHLDQSATHLLFGS